MLLFLKDSEISYLELLDLDDSVAAKILFKSEPPAPRSGGFVFYRLLLEVSRFLCKTGFSGRNTKAFRLSNHNCLNTSKKVSGVKEAILLLWTCKACCRCFAVKLTVLVGIGQHCDSGIAKIESNSNRNFYDDSISG